MEGKLFGFLNPDGSIELIKVVPKPRPSEDLQVCPNDMMMSVLYQLRDIYPEYVEKRLSELQNK